MSTERPARRLGIPSSARLRGAEFQAVFERQPRREQRGSFTALWRMAPGPGKVGFAVGRRIGGAAQRNRARRQLREAYRLERPEHPPGMNVVFVARAGVLDASWKGIRADMQSAMKALRRAAAGKDREPGGTP